MTQDGAHSKSHFPCNSWAQIQCVDKVPAGASFGLSELAESFPGLSDHVPLVLLYFSNQPQLRRPELQQESHFHQTKGSAVHSVICSSSSFPGSGVTRSETGVLCQILLKAGPSSHVPGYGGWGGGWLSRWRGRGQGSQEHLTFVVNSLFPFVPLSLTSKLFYSFYLERSPNLKKNWKWLLCLHDNFMEWCQRRKDSKEALLLSLLHLLLC